MEIVLEILKLTIPGMIVFLTTFYMLRQVLESQYKRKELELRREARQAFTPTKVNAYERLTLFLERIHPSELVLRTHKKGMKGRYFQSELVKSIRTEYQHNLTQQLYVSAEAWGLIKIAKEETIKLINIAASNMPEGASGIDLSNMIFQIMMKMKENPVDVAKDYLRKELRKSL